ncbi:hypothetical protein AQ436_08900 [Arthrobacter sp. EpRS66]|nr:hypothetical protein AQ436_08900 [Arthrobacter sp. EpRS66]
MKSQQVVATIPRRSKNLQDQPQRFFNNVYFVLGHRQQSVKISLPLRYCIATPRVWVRFDVRNNQRLILVAEDL